MKHSDLTFLLNRLLANWENEVIEFKQANKDFKTDVLGEYFSALANEANLHEVDCSWLIFGINNKTRSVVGSDYRVDPERLQSTKMQIAQNTEPSITFRNIYELITPDGRVILFQIPPAPLGMPIAWKGHYYARAGESLTPLSLDKQDEIRKQTIDEDWSAQLVEEANIGLFDEKAVSKARESFAQKHANHFNREEVMEWSILTFLNRAKLTQNGKITRAAILLLGKPESAYLLSPHPAQITWKLEGTERAYEHFGPPLLLNTTVIYQKIRNIQIRILSNNDLVPIEVSKYDQKVILEALHNCIVHQDYSRNGRIVITEFPDKLIFENEGSFFEGHPKDYFMGEKTPRRYRNAFLAQAMAELNMIDTMGYGIYSMHVTQARRYFPMPDYDLNEPIAVKMVLYGSIVDPAYSRLLIQNTDLSLFDILALDRVQKKLPIDNNMIKRLRSAGLIEGRKPNFHISASVAKATDLKADYIRTRAQDDDYYCKLVTDFIYKFGKASRKDIDKLLMDKLSDFLDDDQKKKKIANLLTKLRRSKVIQNNSSKKTPKWVLIK